MKSILVGLALSVLLSTVGLVILATRTFYPKHRIVSLVLLSLGMAVFIFELLSLRYLLLLEERGFSTILSEYSLYTFMILGGISFVYIFNKFIFREPGPLKNLTTDEIKTMLRQDEDNLLYLNQTLERIVKKTGYWENIDPSQISSLKRYKLEEQWQQFVEVSFEIDLIKQRYRAFYKIDLLRNPTLHTNCFVLAYAALITQHKNILALTRNVGKNENLANFLNQPHEALALPAHIYSHLKYRLTHTKTLIRLNAGRAYLSLLRPNENQPLKLLDLINGGLKYLDSHIRSVPKMMLLNPIEVMEQKAFQTWYPLQKKAAEKISYIRTSKRDYLLSPKNLKPYLDRLQPGDILLQRREWHATNLGIPGFWTHLALYTGTLAEIDSTFRGLKELADEKPSAYLKRKSPESYAHMNQKIGRFAPNVIEAKRAGVIVNIVEESALCDSLAILRPKVEPRDIFKAIEEAFSYVGKPYDYTFDFRNDQAFLCSEVIYKAYKNAEKLQLETELINGRPVFRPNKLAQKFSEEIEANAQLEFILFLDGNERTGKVKKETAEAFKQSWKRPKWYILNQYVSYRRKV
jgi:hypothetical protein